MRILNCDRNESNILIKIKNKNNKKKFKFIPIDHGLSFPDRFEIYESPKF